ncbi:MAG: SPFH/Band 7/PHB domain protein [Anaerolineae bacterium]|nr:SPFH/Band 7/PHB domain protein [Anaerolineae bacterium]
METLIIIGVGLALLLLFTALRVVPDFERLVVLQLGKYQGTRGPGLTFILPVLEKAYKVDLREKFLDIPAQTAITKDNASILIDFLVYYRITDPMLSILKVDHVERASANIATTTLRAVIGDIDLDGVLSQRETINDVLRVKLDEATERWGLKVTAVEIREIEPPRDILDAMNRQMSAERERRAEVTRAQGEREAAITRAEGQKQSAILKAEGDRQAAILEAEGSRQAQLLKAQGYAKSLEAIYESAQHLDEKTMALQYMEMLEQIGSSPSTKFVVPMELVSFVSQFASTAGLMVSNSNGHKAEERTPISGD